MLVLDREHVVADKAPWYLYCNLNIMSAQTCLLECNVGGDEGMEDADDSSHCRKNSQE